MVEKMRGPIPQVEFFQSNDAHDLRNRINNFLKNYDADDLISVNYRHDFKQNSENGTVYDEVWTAIVVYKEIPL